MTSRKSGLIRSALTRKGFVERTGKDVYLHYYSDGKRSSVFTKVSNSNSGFEIGDSLLGKMAKQLYLSKEQLLALIDCTMTQAQFEAEVTKRTTL